MNTLLLRGDISVKVDFQPGSMGVVVHAPHGKYHPEWRPPEELQQRTNVRGSPSYWATDGKTIMFDVPADIDYPVTYEAQ